MREVNVEGLQCTQAVMTVLREMVSMEEGEEIQNWRRGDGTPAKRNTTFLESFQS